MIRIVTSTTYVIDFGEGERAMLPIFGVWGYQSIQKWSKSGTKTPNRDVLSSYKGTETLEPY